MIYSLGDLVPKIAEDAYVADSAIIIGSVRIASKASVWYGTVLRGDNDLIEIGERSNIQDGTVIHVDKNTPTKIGKNVSIGHSAMVHGCTIDDGSLIGIGSVILDNARIGKNSLVGAKSLVTEGKIFPDDSLILGSPAKLIRTLTEQEISRLFANAEIYVNRLLQYKSELYPIS
ncbi:MAG: gamma carbonic anhydrase family protein [Acidiferrobacteraceae bacterium]|nr:gamma carbonic anhydrase family protein [Acidiferrobacteraceae bacterium]